MELVKFIFQDFWHFIGFFFLFMIFCGAIASIGRKYVIDNKCNSYKNYEDKDKENV